MKSIRIGLWPLAVLAIGIAIASCGSSKTISIFVREGTENEVARNYGVENEGPFIHLRPIDWSETGPNDGIEPPECSGATATGATGPRSPVLSFESSATNT